MSKKKTSLNGNIVPILITSGVELTKTQTLCQNTCENELAVITRELKHILHTLRDITPVFDLYSRRSGVLFQQNNDNEGGWSSILCLNELRIVFHRPQHIVEALYYR